MKHGRDPEAAWNAQEGRKRCYGYKLPVAMEQGSHILRRLLVTPANENETVTPRRWSWAISGGSMPTRSMTPTGAAGSLPARGSRILRRLLVTPANVNETAAVPALIMGDERRVYADKAYDTDERRRACPHAASASCAGCSSPLPMRTRP